MKTMVKLTLYADLSHQSVIHEFRQLFPFGLPEAGFRLSLTPDDPRLKLLLDEIKSREIPDIRSFLKPRPKVQYGLEYHRRYESRDFDAAEYLHLLHEVAVYGYLLERDAQGRVRIPLEFLRPGIQVGSVKLAITIVSSALRDKIERARLIGPQFQEVVAVTAEEEQEHQDFWEVASTVIMPPMPRERLLCRKQTPNDFQVVDGVRDEGFNEKELHFPESSVRELEPFDFALTFETINQERWPVVSQRFRQFCLAQKLPLAWRPVRLDPS